VALATLLALAAFSSVVDAKQDKTAKGPNDAADAAKEQTDATTIEESAQEQPITTEATAWGKYHWARTANPFALKLGDNVTSDWDAFLKTTSVDWTKSDSLDTSVVGGQSSAKRCGATTGRVEVCNAKYGNNGWLGIASIWLSGDHITQGTTKMNDSYFTTDRYNKDAWKNMVMCQEVGHTLGLGHDNETFTDPNKGTCMDYTNDPSGKAGTNGPSSNEHPNTADYDLLKEIYTHQDSSTTLGQTTTDDNVPGDGPPAWGREKSRSADGRESIFEKDLGKGKKKLTHVLWTLERAAQHRGGGPDKDHEHQDEDHEHQETQPEQQQQD
jgi:hypothetical protein